VGDERDGGLSPADVAFVDALVTDGDGGAAAPDVGVEASEQRALVQGGRGCGCSAGADTSGLGAFGVVGLGLVLRRGRRRVHSPSKAYS
jgi:MYXO-CTERM domain-containing protein